MREYLRKGFYSYLVKERKLTIERVKQITAGITLSTLRPPNPVSLNANDPKDFLLYADDGCFILYDKKLKDLLDQDKEDNHFWYERFIKGTSFAGGGYVSVDRFFLHQLGGDTLPITKLMLLLTLSYCREENLPLYVYDEDLKYLDQNQVEIQQKNLVRLKSAPFAYKQLALQERQFRASFDRYDEFKVRLLEMAEAKFRD